MIRKVPDSVNALKFSSGSERSLSAASALAASIGCNERAFATSSPRSVGRVAGSTSTCSFGMGVEGLIAPPSLRRGFGRRTCAESSVHRSVSHTSLGQLAVRQRLLVEEPVGLPEWTVRGDRPPQRLFKLRSDTPYFDMMRGTMGGWPRYRTE